MSNPPKWDPGVSLIEDRYGLMTQRKRSSMGRSSMHRGSEVLGRTDDTPGASAKSLSIAEPGQEPPNRSDSAEDERAATPEGALDFVWHAFHNLNEWVRFSDAKAGAVLTFDGVVITALATVLAGNRPPELQTFAAVLWITSVMTASFCSALFALGSLMPQLSLKKPAKAAEGSSEESSSLVFFMDIDARFPTSQQFHRAVCEALAEPHQAVVEISQQTWANSKVAALKYHRVSLSLWSLLVAVALGFGGCLVLAFYYAVEAVYAG